MDSITEFLEARVADDEAAASRAAEVFPGSWAVEDRGHYAHVVSDGPSFHYVSELDERQAPGAWLGGALQTVANFQPTRVLAECAAKRAIIDENEIVQEKYLRDYCATCADWDNSELGEGPPNVLWPCPSIRALASVYADHRDYQQEWARG